MEYLRAVEGLEFSLSLAISDWRSSRSSCCELSSWWFHSKSSPNRALSKEGISNCLCKEQNCPTAILRELLYLFVRWVLECFGTPAINLLYREQVSIAGGGLGRGADLHLPTPFRDGQNNFYTSNVEELSKNKRSAKSNMSEVGNCICVNFALKTNQ